MSLPRYAAKRDISEPEIFDTLRDMGMSVYPLSVPCDGLVGFRGKTYLVECKTARKRGGKDQKTTAQAKFLETWRGQYVVLKDTEQAQAWALSVASGDA